MFKNLFLHVRNFNIAAFIGFLFYNLFLLIIGFVLGGLYATHCI